MRQHLASLAFVSLVGGCSLIYNPSNIPQGMSDAAPDMMIDAAIDAPLADADPSMLSITSFTPTTIDEGQGDGGTRPMMLVISGSQMVPGATVSIMSTPQAMISADNAQLQVAGDGNSIAVPVTALVDDTLTGDVDLTITITQAGTVMRTATQTLKLKKLGTLKTLVGTDSAQLANKQFAKIDLGSAAITWTGTAPVILKSVTTINVPDMIASGGDGAKNAAGAAGPGGCAGGAPQQAGGCAGDLGGGGPAQASSSGGGGGGGYAAPGSPGGGTGAGTAGQKLGEATVLDYMVDHASGGGGGAAGTLSSAAGGGGGGGTIELTAGGAITAGAITVKGGAGGAAGALLGGAGGGGGGAGGTVVIRSANGALTVGAITATGGGSGSGAQGGGAGGAGAAGRVRADAPSGTLPAGAHQNPTFATSTVQIQTTNMPMVTVNGTTGDAFDVYVVDSAGNIHTDAQPTNQTIGQNGLKQFMPILSAGYNQLCVRIHSATTPSTFDLSDTCIEMAFLPSG